MTATLQKGNFMKQFGGIDVPVRALSWYQPYASLMLHSKQETRRRDTKVRGWVLICSCAKAYSNEMVLEIGGGEWQYDRTWHMLMGSEQPLGQAIAIGYLHNSRPMTEKDEDATFVKYREGLWVWEFSNVHPIKAFEWKGKQGWSILDSETKGRIEVI